jgi:hypothetical protein
MDCIVPRPRRAPRLSIPALGACTALLAAPALGNPPNDDCADAILLSCGQVVSGSTVTAEEDPEAADTDCDGFDSDTGGVWYRIIGNGLTMVVSTCSPLTDFDTEVGVFVGDCDRLFCVGGNDDIGCEANSLASQVAWLSIPGEEYLIFVTECCSGPGTFQLTVDCYKESPPNDFCADAIPLSVPSSILGQTVTATTDAFVADCGQEAPGVWYAVVGTGGTMTATTCSLQSTYDTRIGVYCGTCFDLTCVADNDDSCGIDAGLASTVEWCSVAGAAYFILVNGFDDEIGKFRLTVTSDSQPCQPEVECPTSCGNPDAGNCFHDHGPASPGCDTEKCCNLICGIDPWCCQVTWDQTCVDEALIHCANCGGADAGNCFQANGSPGCNDAACCQTICQIDAYCCHVQWDSVCADEAEANCQGPGVPCPGEGPCRTAHPSPGCQDQACCELICSLDPFCCEVEWDQACADAAIELCPNIGTCPGQGPCTVPNGSPGCEDEICCTVVCGQDPFCCGVEWDQACADAAADLCVKVCPGSGSCFQAQGNPGCDDDECCKTVCFVDPFCCIVQWDGLCAAEAGKLCTPGCCEGDLTPEGEPCGSDTNGGCNSTPVIFSNISCGQGFCGTAWAQSGVRDTDWYVIWFDNAGGGAQTDDCIRLRSSLRSEFNGVNFIVGGIENCSPEVLGQPGASDNCETILPAEAEIFLDGIPGLSDDVYVVFVATSAFDGTPCGGGDNEYTFDLTCEPCHPPLSCPGDVTADLTVDVQDLMVVIADVGCVGPACAGDANLDGACDVVDIITVFMQWGPCDQ